MITNRLELCKKKENVMHLKGGVVMGKLLFVIALCLSFTAIAGAYDVINIDINGSAFDPVYTGLGPFGDPTWAIVNVWNGYYQGNGVMMASPRCANIGTPGSPGTYGRAIFMADPCSHNYQPYTTGHDLLDDGFVKTPPPTDPNPGLFFWGTLSYGGVYDVYVISKTAGSFTITDSNGDTQSASVTGGDIPWQEGTNYVKFEDVEIDTPDSRNEANEPDPENYPYLSDPNCVVLNYSNQINGIQFASVKRIQMALRGVPPNDPNFDSVGNTAAYWSTATPIYIGTTGKKQNVFAGDYDVGYDTNLRGGEPDPDGPDVGWTTGTMHYIDKGEIWTYDVHIDDISDGYYRIRFLVNLHSATSANFSMYIDDSLELGNMNVEVRDGVDANSDYWTTDSANLTCVPAPGYLYFNFFKGLKRFKIKANQAYFDIKGFQFHHMYTQNSFDMDLCSDVIAYGYGLDGDVNSDCYVNFEDLKLIVDDWAGCNDPCECEAEEPAW